MKRRSARSECMLGAITLVIACGPSAGIMKSGVPYLDDVHYRRAELEASIVNPQNAYSALRLARYASETDRDWDSLPEWNPPTEPIAAGALDLPGGASIDAFEATPIALDLPESIASEDDPALVSLGREAFRRYPVQLAPYFGEGLHSRGAAARYGLWTDPARGVGGLVRARMADGSPALAMTCASCHAARREDASDDTTDAPIDDGLPNAKLDLGAAILASGQAPSDPAISSAIAAWGAGRIDVTTNDGSYPARISDLRAVRWQTFLHQEGTLRHRNRTSLAIRIETLIITSSAQVIRPPRIVALALAAYVESLADALSSTERATAASPRGAELFASNCATCHAPPGLTGDPVPLDVIGTDPWLGSSPDRGTGAYRVPSLHGVGARGPLLHDGTIPSVAAMLDPARPTAAFSARLHGAGAVEGHPFGLDLPAPDRAALIAWLNLL